MKLSKKTWQFGLFGLSTYTVQLKNKEISIRKVLGASVLGNVKLLSKDYLSLTIIANINGLPLAYYLLNLWLEDFIYRIEVNYSILGIDKNY